MEAYHISTFDISDKVIAMMMIYLTFSADYVNNYFPQCMFKLSLQNADLFDWDEETQGLILSAFFWGYVVLQIPGGLLADKFGGKYVLGFGILGSSIFTLLIPVAAKAGYGWLLATLVTKGLTEVCSMFYRP